MESSVPRDRGPFQVLAEYDTAMIRSD